MNLRHIIFILVYFLATIISISTSSSIASDELLSPQPAATAGDREKSESQIELPPLSTITIDDNALVVDDTEENNNDEVFAATTINSATTEQAETLDAKQATDNKESTQRHENEKASESENDEVGTQEGLMERTDADNDVDGSLSSGSSSDSESIQENLTIPVFSEWTQQQQEAEKKLVELSSNATESNKEIKNETLAKHQIVKMRQKNYALPDCGAKVLASNPEAQSTSSVLSDKDEYMLSPCTDRIWFVVELCDSIQAQRVELANFELFSSPLKSVSISLSNRFPTREWTIAGHFDAKSERGVQNFDLKDVTLFGKFVRVDLEYTNTEHYCPLSFFRIFGTSEIEAFEVENEPENRLSHLDDEDDYMHAHSQHKIENNKDNILNRAGAAVLSIVQKAAEVLVKSNGSGAKQNATSSMKIFDENCMSLSHNIVCESCSSDERASLHTLISCKNAALSGLLDREVKSHLINSIACSSVLGFHLQSDIAIERSNKNFIASILPEKYIAAMCNLVAGDQSKLTLRVDEDISDIAANLISKKDEVSLKNVSKKDSDVQCKHSSVETTLPTTVSTDDTIASVGNATENSLETTTAAADNSAGDGDAKNMSAVQEQNIFNRIDRQPFIESELEEKAPSSDQSKTEASTVSEPPIGVTKPYEEREEIKQEIPKIDSQNSKANSELRQQQQNKVISELAASGGSEPKTNQSSETKPNGSDQRVLTTPSSSNAPESVFLRLSNRIKILEKNMTLSTQYLEELSRRYKKQIEDLQQSYAKLQIQYDNLNQSKKESEKRDAGDRKRVQEDIEELDTKAHYMEIILIVLAAFLVLQSILIVVLFKRISILRDVFVINEDRTLIERGLEDGDNHLSAEPASTENTTNRSTNRKRSKQRVRKISAPNILSRQNNGQPFQNGGGRHSEFTSPKLALSRTSSAPHKVNEFLEMKENMPNFEHSSMLEENDEILIPNFEELKIKDDDHEEGGGDRKEEEGEDENYERSSPKAKSRSDDDTASTASVKTTDDQTSNSGFNLARRLSSPTQFLKLKKTTPMKVKNGRIHHYHHHKKAKSESPPKINSTTSSSKSNSFQAEDRESKSNDESFKFRKNNSFKKLFKKLF